MSKCQESCACTRFSCMHNTLVHTQHSCACSGPDNPGARDPKRARSRAWDRPSALFGSLAPGFPGPEHARECCACTRFLVYTQEIPLCIHKRLSRQTHFFVPGIVGTRNWKLSRWAHCVAFLELRLEIRAGGHIFSFGHFWETTWKTVQVVRISFSGIFGSF